MERSEERAAAEAARRRFRREQAAHRTAVQSIAICFGAALAGALFFSYVLAFMIATAGAALAVARLGPKAFAQSLGSAPAPWDFALGIAGAGIGLAIGFAYVFVVTGAGSSILQAEWTTPPLFAILTIAVLPAFLEEWTCRGALWTICRRVTGRGATLAISAVLFGLLHAPMWGWAGVPSRILLGFVFGALRLRTGGLTAPITAHLLNNFVAIGFLAAL